MQEESSASDKMPAIAYIVSVWPRLSETFILNEVLGLESRGARLRILSIKKPDAGTALARERVARVRAETICLSGASHWRAAFGPSLRVLARHPFRYCRTALLACRYRRWGARKRFFQAVCLADMLRRRPVAHLHAHFAHEPTMVAMFTHRLTGIPYSFTAHAKDIYVKTPPELLRAEVARARAVVTCTEYNRQFLLDRFESARGKVHRVYHGLDLSQFRFEPHANGSAPPLILSVARLVEKKGLGDLLTAVDILRRRGKSVRVEIIGEGPLRPELEARIAQLGLGGRVTLLGAQPHEAVRQAYARSLVFALPCVVAADGDRDGIPNVLLEAMASGVPVVSTPVSGIPELIEPDREGLLVRPGDAGLLADALDRLLTNSELRERLALAARAKVEACFSIQANVGQLLKLFQNGRAQ